MANLYSSSDNSRRWGVRPKDIVKLHEQGLRSCSKCLEVKPLAQFHRDYSHPHSHGYQRTCKNCQRIYRTEWRHANGIKGRAAQGVTYQTLKEWRQRNPEKARAHTKVAYALKKGKLKKQDCHCGRPGEAHHDDYSKPLEVRWLCRQHHREWHRAHPEVETMFLDWNLYPSLKNYRNTAKKLENEGDVTFP